MNGVVDLSASPAVRDRMSRQRRVDTDPEIRLRKALHGLGYRYRVHMKVPGRPRRTMDVGFTRVRVAVFVDGCFWHVCPEHGTWPENNAEWWRSKLIANVERDRDTDALLASEDWAVVRIWEHEPVDVAASKIIKIVEGRRGVGTHGGEGS